MTSDFDNLSSILYYIKDTDSNYKQKLEVAEWLADICIKQADEKEKNWNFKIWKCMPKWKGKSIDIQAKYDYLSDCHSVLDHRNWHLKVFDYDIQCLIRVMSDAFEGKEIWGLKKNILKIQGFSDALKKLGYKPTKHKGEWENNDK